MNFLLDKRTFIFLGIFFFLSLFFIDLTNALILPPDPFESTDRFAALIPSSDGTIARVQAKVKAPGPKALGIGELRALFRYKLLSSHRKVFHFSVSKGLSGQGLSNTTPTLIEFDFSGNPIPAEAYHRTLQIYYQEKPESVPGLVSEYRPEQLLLKPSENVVETSLTTQGAGQWGPPIWGPTTFLREREEPKTEKISFTVSDPNGSFVLRLTNGTPEGTNRVSSAVVKLNGREILRPSEFNQYVAEISHQVTLLSGENLLEVRLRSAPGAFITIGHFRLDKQACDVLDIHTFSRRKGKPVVETLTFESKPGFSEPFTLYLTNGDSTGGHRVDSAIIRLNGQLIFDPNDFNERVSDLSQVVSLQSINTLSVELRGAPGDFLALEIKGYDTIPPYVRITNPSDGNTFKVSPITLGGIVDDPSSSLTVNGITTPIASDGSFTVEGLILQEGENIIKAVATDACGNQGEDQILVYLRTIPEGPKLVLCAEPFLERTPKQVPPDCHDQDLATSTGVISGLTDDTAISVTLNGVLLPREATISDEGDIYSGMRDGDFFWAFVKIPQVDGIHPFTAVATNAEGSQSEATVTFVRDTVAPKLAVTSPTDGLVTRNPEIIITGTVDDPEATVLLDWWIEIPVEDGSFTTTYTLSKEGLKYLTIAAIDPSGNASYVNLRVILDTLPPQIDVTHPIEGMVVNAPTLNLIGNIVDPNMKEVTVEVNSSSPQLLNLIGTNFSGTIALNPGLNTLALNATDKAGNTARVTLSVILDVDVPIVSITSPSFGATVSGTITVTVDAGDMISGVDGVTLLLDGQIISTLNQAPFNFSLDTSGLVPGSHILTARAIDRVGNQTEASITVTVVEPVRIEITSPINGATINKSSAVVQGMVYNQMGESGVVVGSVLAEVQGSDFAATVPLQIGQNTITAVATGDDGVQGQASITINTETQEEFVRVTAIPTSGTLDQTGVLNVTFEAEVSLVNPVSSYSWDFNGDGIPEMIGTQSTVIAQYQFPGLYFPKVTVTDSQNNTYAETSIVHVLSRETMDALLKSKWEGMKAALIQGNINEALNYFMKDSREEYQEIFELLAPQLSMLVSAMREINVVEIKGNLAEYCIKRFQRGVDMSYFIYFMRDENGVWKISSF